MDRILDERTQSPIKYPDLLQEARALTEELPNLSLPAACRKIAEKANPDKADSIERHLRRLYNARPEANAGSKERRPADALAGWGAWSAVLQVAAFQLEEQWDQMEKAQHFSAHQVGIYLERARRIRSVAEERLSFLESVERDEALAALRGFLGSLAEVDPGLEAAAFLDAEIRAAQLVVTVAQRVADETMGMLDYLAPEKRRVR